MPGKLVLRYMDNEGESSSFGVYGANFSAANYDAQNTLMDALITAVGNVTRGNQVHTTRMYSDSDGPASGPPADVEAQREQKWLVTYHGDGSLKKFRAEIPTADVQVKPSGTEFMDLTAGVGLALVTAFEAYVRSPDDPAETVTVDTIRLVHRNL